MTLPKAVQAQADAAEAMQKELIGESNTPEVETPEAKAPVEEPTPEATEPKEVQTEIPPVEASEPSEVDWKARAEAAETRYKVLQGKYNAEVKKGGADAADQSAVIAQLQAQIAELQVQAQQPTPSPEPMQPPAFSEADLARLTEDYGEEFVADLGRLVESRVENLVQNRMQQVDQQVHQLSHQQRINLLTTRLAQEGIDFDRVNADPLFLQWLGEIEPMAGTTRQALLNAAFEQAGDIERTALIFRQFVESAPNNTPSSNIPTPEQLAQVKATAPAQVAPPEQVAWSPDAIAALYEQARRGLISQEELQSRERELFASLNR